MVNSEPKVLDEVSHRILKKIGEIDPHSCESNKEKEIEIWSWKRKQSEKWHAWLDRNTGHLRKSKN